MSAYPTLFSPIDIGSMRLKNRIVMAPMESHLGNADGPVSKESIAYRAVQDLRRSLADQELIAC